MTNKEQLFAAAIDRFNAMEEKLGKTDPDYIKTEQYRDFRSNFFFGLVEKYGRKVPFGNGQGSDSDHPHQHYKKAINDYQNSRESKGLARATGKMGRGIVLAAVATGTAVFALGRETLKSILSTSSGRSTAKDKSMNESKAFPEKKPVKTDAIGNKGPLPLKEEVRRVERKTRKLGPYTPKKRISGKKSR